MARARKKPPLGKTAFAIVGPSGTLQETPYGKGAALLMAQKHAEHAKTDVKLTVEIRPLFGEPVPVFHVERAGKNVYTLTVNDVD